MTDQPGQRDFWEQVADRQIVPSVKRKLARQDIRAVKIARDKEIRDEQRQLALYKNWKREVRAEMVALHGDKLEGLIRMLKNLTLESAADLVDYIERADWLLNADPHSRITILSYIDDAIIRVRERHGLSPFDDTIPMLDEEQTAFEIIRKLLTGV